MSFFLHRPLRHGFFYIRGAFRFGAASLHGLGSYGWSYYFRPSALNDQKEKDNQCSQISLRAPNRARVHCMLNPHGSLIPFNSPVTWCIPTPLYGCQDQGQQMVPGKDHMWVGEQVDRDLQAPELLKNPWGAAGRPWNSRCLPHCLPSSVLIHAVEKCFPLSS